MKTLKSVDFWLAIITILWISFTYLYPRYFAVYESNLDAIFAPMEWYFICIMGIGIIGFIWGIVTKD